MDTFDFGVGADNILTTFGEALKDLLNNKSINKTRFAKSLYIQRSTLYKYIADTTLPD